MIYNINSQHTRSNKRRRIRSSSNTNNCFHTASIITDFEEEKKEEGQPQYYFHHHHQQLMIQEHPQHQIPKFITMKDPFEEAYHNHHQLRHRSQQKQQKQQQMPSHHHALHHDRPMRIIRGRRPQQSSFSTASSSSSRIAKEVSDNIHRRVQVMLSKSRLTSLSSSSSSSAIRLIRPEEVESVDRVLGSGSFSKVSAVTVRGIVGEGGRKRQQYACKHLQKSLLLGGGGNTGSKSQQSNHDKENVDYGKQQQGSGGGEANAAASAEEFELAASELALEAHILSNLHHPNVIKIRGWNLGGVSAYKNGNHDSFFLLLDVLHETLEQRIDRWRTARRSRNRSRYNKRAAASSGNAVPAAKTAGVYYADKVRILREIASALEYLHTKGIIFRDLKPANLGFSPDEDSVRIFDFGLSRELPSLDTSVPFAMSGRVGTLRYMAPEVARNEPYNLSADVYSYGIVAYELLTLQKPYDGFTKELHSDLVCQRGHRPEFHLRGDGSDECNNIPSDMIDLVERSWSADPSQRCPMSEIHSTLRRWSQQPSSSSLQQPQHTTYNCYSWNNMMTPIDAVTVCCSPREGKHPPLLFNQDRILPSYNHQDCNRFDLLFSSEIQQQHQQQHLHKQVQFQHRPLPPPPANFIPINGATAATMVSNDQLAMSALSFESIETIEQELLPPPPPLQQLHKNHQLLFSSPPMDTVGCSSFEDDDTIPSCFSEGIFPVVPDLVRYPYNHQLQLQEPFYNRHGGNHYPQQQYNNWYCGTKRGRDNEDYEAIHYHHHHNRSITLPQHAF